MAKPLRSQLNQIRAWVRQGRTDAWIAHQLEVSTSELREFRRRHELNVDEGEETGDDLRDEIEAEIEAATKEEAEAQAAEEAEEPAQEDRPADDDGDEEERPRRRRRRRRGRGGSRARGALQGTFDHGDKDGYGLWLDPAVADDPVYAEHWAGKRRVEVTVEADQIVIKRSE